MVRAVVVWSVEHKLDWRPEARHPRLMQWQLVQKLQIGVKEVLE
jgi:hypothetical protein